MMSKFCLSYLAPGACPLRSVPVSAMHLLTQKGWSEPDGMKKEIIINAAPTKPV